MENYSKIKIGKYTLGDFQNNLLHILIEFDRFCRENNINYSLAFGTLLGSVRHKGFIPWDDDIDVFMLRKDYKKFKKVFKNNKISGLILEDSIINHDYPYFFSKLKLNYTYCPESWTINKKINQGLWIDIFPLDNTTRFFHPIQRKISSFCCGLRMTKLGFPVQYKYQKQLCFLSKIFSFSIINFIQNFLIRFLNMFCCKKVALIAHPMKEVLYEKHDYMNLIEVQFENSNFFIPKNYVDHLISLYGDDYMKYPPKSERQTNHIAVSEDLIILRDFNH